MIAAFTNNRAAVAALVAQPGQRFARYMVLLGQQSRRGGSGGPTTKALTPYMVLLDQQSRRGGSGGPATKAFTR